MVAVNVSIDLDDLPEPSIDDDAVSDWIARCLNEARNLFIQRVSRGGGSGKTYRRGRGRYHRASSAGEYPATDSGRLVSSIDWRMNGPREGTLYSDLEYSRYLADGTGRMSARRMLGDALTEVLESRPATDRLASAARIK